MPKGHPLRNVSDYAWYNNNYWVDLFPKLMMRVLRNVKFTGDLEFLKKNWETLKFGLEALLKQDYDDDGIPEGYPEEVKNTFDNLVLFGADAYDATQFLGGCQAMIKMAQMLGDQGRRGASPAGFRQRLEEPRTALAGRRRTRRARNSSIISLVSIPRRGKRIPTCGPTSSTRCGISCPSAKNRSFPKAVSKRFSRRFTGTTARPWAGPCAKLKTASPWNRTRGRMSIRLPITSSPSCWTITAWSRRARMSTSTWTGSFSITATR